jgi:hypothetical protein
LIAGAFSGLAAQPPVSGIKAASALFPERLERAGVFGRRFFD